MKRRILFVDDEPNILDGLRQRLFRQRQKWEMKFVTSGAEALALLAGEPVDVVVTDMRMPGMDGAELLRRVHADHPRVVRIVLSGHSELESALRAVPVTHQFLAKPCEAGVLEAVIEKACNLSALLEQEVLRSLVGKVSSLPALPRVYVALRVATLDERVGAAEIARIIQKDTAISAKTLQIVNSAYFRLARRVSRVEEAVAYLGMKTLQQVVLTVEVFQWAAVRPELRATLERLQNHALAVAALAKRFFADKAIQEDAFVAGLLHDVGKLVLAVQLPDEMAAIAAEVDHGGVTWRQAEQRRWGVSHAEVGGYLLGLWGLPYQVVEAVANHHEPGRVAGEALSLLAAVHLADGLVNERGGDPGGEGLDLELVARLGKSAELDTWRRWAGDDQGDEARVGAPCGGRDELA